MELKNDLDADALANLYRAALYIGRGSRDVGLQFLNKAKERLGKKVEIQFDSSKDLKVTAENVLDNYKKLKYNLPSS